MYLYRSGSVIYESRLAVNPNVSTGTILDTIRNNTINGTFGQYEIDVDSLKAERKWIITIH